MLGMAVPQASAQATSQPAATGPAQPEAAKRTREVAAFNRRQATLAASESKSQLEPAKTAMMDEAKLKEELVAALEKMADAQDAGDNAGIIALNTQQNALVTQCIAAGERSKAARQEVALRSPTPVNNLKANAQPFDIAQIEQFAGLRERAADAWAKFRKVSLENPDGRGVQSAKITATQYTLAADRHERIVKLQLEASRIMLLAEKSETPDLAKKLANDIQNLARELGENLEKQNELKLKELELMYKNQSLLDEARLYQTK